MNTRNTRSEAYLPIACSLLLLLLLLSLLPYGTFQYYFDVFYETCTIWYKKLLYAKKSNLVSGNRPGEIFFITYPPASRMCIRIYIFDFKNKQTSKKEYKKAKETKEEKIISVEN